MNKEDLSFCYTGSEVSAHGHVTLSEAAQCITAEHKEKPRKVETISSSPVSLLSALSSAACHDIPNTTCQIKITSLGILSTVYIPFLKFLAIPPAPQILAQFFIHAFSFILLIFFLLTSLIYFLFISSLKSLFLQVDLFNKSTISVFLDLAIELVSFGGIILPCFFVSCIV